MARPLLFSLLVFALASCQPESSGDGSNSSSTAQLAAYQNDIGKNATPEDSPVRKARSTTHTQEAPAPTSAPPAVKKTQAEAGNPEKTTPDAESEATTPEASIPAAQHNDTAPENTSQAPPSHETWDNLLRKHVSSSGKVDYKGFLGDKEKLQAYLDELAARPPSASWARNERLAYWINAYNAFTVKLILDHYPVSSITKIHDGKPWDVKWIKLGGKTYSLNNIENDIIRPRFEEPRIHFAVNCAARSCPPLLNRAWTAGNLDNYLKQQTRSFINDSRYNKISPQAVEVSKIFEWYAKDFGNLTDYLNQYAEARVNPDAKVSYKEYDWSLND